MPPHSTEFRTADDRAENKVERPHPPRGLTLFPQFVTDRDGKSAAGCFGVCALPLIPASLNVWNRLNLCQFNLMEDDL
jgi:hypothetical protein